MSFPSRMKGLWPGPRIGLRERRLRILAIIAVLAVIALAVVLQVRGHFPTVSAVGYPAVFLLSLFGSASIIVPIPGFASVCTGGVLLTPVIVAVVAAVGEATGELTGYMAGFGGRGVLEKRRLYWRLEKWMRRRGGIILFILSVIPNPVFDIAGIAAGALRYPLWRFWPIVATGKFLKSLGVAYACSYGYDIYRFFLFGETTS